MSSMSAPRSAPRVAFLHTGAVNIAPFGELASEFLPGATVVNYLDDKIEELYRERLFYSDVVADYEDLVRRQDLVLGYRLHGNLMALANRTPSIYFSYDSRTVEFAETFAIPCYDVFSQKPFVLEEYWDQARFERFNRTYYQRFRDMRAFLDENFIDHKMHHGVAKPRRLQVA